MEFDEFAEASNKDVEASNKDLSLKLEAASRALRDSLKKLDDRTWANDDALYTGLAIAQYDIQCGPNPPGATWRRRLSRPARRARCRLQGTPRRVESSPHLRARSKKRPYGHLLDTADS